MMPPMPMTGIFTALTACQTWYRATGLIAGPERPPYTLASLGLFVSISMDIPVSVLINDMASAPASSTPFAITLMSVTLGVNFTMTGLLVFFIFFFVTLAET